MRHFVGRVDIASGNVKLLREVESSEDAVCKIHEANQENDNINKANNLLKIAKGKLPSYIPHYNPELHGTLNQYMRLKKKLKIEYKDSLSPEDRKLYHEPFTEPVIPVGTKLVYVTVHELKELQ
jgi:hypothetical protein